MDGEKIAKVKAALSAATRGAITSLASVTHKIQAASSTDDLLQIGFLLRFVSMIHHRHVNKYLEIVDDSGFSERDRPVAMTDLGKAEDLLKTQSSTSPCTLLKSCSLN